MTPEPAATPPPPAPARPPRRPRRFLAALLSLLSPGMGHLYAGRWRLALGLGLAWLVASVPFAYALRAGFAPLVAAAGLYASGFVGILGHAIRVAGAAPERSGGRGPRAFFLLAYFAVASAAHGLAGHLLRRHLVQTLYVPSGSMLPTLEVGDLVVVAPGDPVERGAVVAFAAPPGSPTADLFVKRVAALGGDTVTVEDGALLLGGRPVERRPDGGTAVETRAEDGAWRGELALRFAEVNGGRAYRTLCTPERPCGDVPPTPVPPGKLFILGDFRDHSADSRVFGPVAESSVIGRVRYVYWSFGPRGVRWARLGRRVE